MDRQQEALKLQRQAQNREKRRAQGHRNDDGAYDDAKPRKKRAEPLKAAQQAYAAVMAAAALAPQPVQRCELCQASFVTEAQLQQHLEGPVHKKAVEKAAKEAAKQAHLNQHSAVAQEALAAAAWLSGGSSAPAAGAAGSSHNHHRPQQQTQQQQQQQGRQQGKPQQQQQKGRQGWGPGGRGHAGSREEQLTHEQVLAAAKQDSGPLSIDGWVPPSVPAQPVPQPAATAHQGSHRPAAGTDSQANGPAADYSRKAAATDPQQPAGAPTAGAEQPTEHATGDGGGGGDSANSDSSSSSGGSSESDDDGDVPQTFDSFF